MLPLRELFVLFHHWNPVVRNEAVETALSRARGDELLTVCAELELVGSLVVGHTIADTLTEIRDPASVPALCILLNSRNLWVRKGARSALEAMRSPDIARLLVPLLFDARGEVVEKAVELLSAVHAEGEELETALKCAIEYWEARSQPLTRKLMGLLKSLQPPPSDLPIPSTGPGSAAETLPLPMVSRTVSRDALPAPAEPCDVGG